MKSIAKFFLSVVLIQSVTFGLTAREKQSVYKVDNETYGLLKKLSSSQLSTGDIYLFTTTHQDLGWLDHIENCIINRDTLWLTPFFNRLREEPDFKMDIEQSSIVMEYLERHPEKKDLIRKYLDEGRICVGATYIQPYEELYSGESLSRQFYFGKKWLIDTFGYLPSSYFNVDVPGRTPQMPQIMSKAGVENLIISRHQRGLFNWASKDGSKVRTYSPGHYIYFYNVLAKPDAEAVKELAKEAVMWYENYNDVEGKRAVMPAMLNYEFIWEQKPVENCIPFMNLWNNIKYIENEEGDQMPVTLPKFKYAIADEFFETLDSSTSALPEYSGERPDVWLYIHSPSHEKAITASRQGDIMLPAAEKISSFAALAEKSFVRYPQEQLTDAWMAKIYPDHGWGGKNGTMTDNVFKEKFDYALVSANNILKESLASLASDIRTNRKKGIPVVVANTLSWERTDAVTTIVKFDKGVAPGVAVYDQSGHLAKSQLSDVKYYEDNSIMSAKLYFVANVPSMGYSTYYVKPARQSNADENTNNPYYDIEFGKGGIKSIFDKELGVELLKSDKFLGGEVITMQSVGNGAGEFDAVQQPTMEGFDQLSNYDSEWSLVESGDVYSLYITRSPIRNAVVELSLKVYNSVKKLDFDIAVKNWEGVLYREYRMMLPVDIVGGDVSYEVPYGVVTVGKDEMPGAAGERYYVENKQQRPRGIENWISASGDKFGVTLSSSVGVVDYVDPTTSPADNSILQPVLFASRRSCHGEGNEYLQHGDHYYHFSMTSHKPGWNNGFRHGEESSEQLFVVYNPKQSADASMPSRYSFFEIDNKNVIVSAVKKSEDDNSLIIRLYNIGGNDEVVNLVTKEKPISIKKTNLIEQEISAVDRIEITPYSIETYKLEY